MSRIERSAARRSIGSFVGVALRVPGGGDLERVRKAQVVAGAQLGRLARYLLVKRDKLRIAAVHDTIEVSVRKGP